MRKIVVFTFVFLLSISATSAFYDADHTFDFQDTVYGSEVTITASCDPDTGVCGTAGGSSSRDIETSCRQRDLSISLNPQTVANDLVDYEGSSLIEIPHYVNCGIGTHEARLIDPTNDQVLAEDTFEVTPFNKPDSNKGNYILTAIEGSPTEILGYNPTPPSLNHFFLTNSAGTGGDNYPKPPNGAYLLTDYFDDNAGPGETELAENYKYGAFEPNYGDVLEKGDGNLAAITARDQKYTGDGGGNGNWWKGTGFTGDPSNLWDYVVTQNFDESMDLRYRFNGCKVGRAFTTVDLTFGNCASLTEKDGSFNPEGEIITATDMSRDDTNYYSDLSNENIVSKEKTNFYVCRGDYRGTDIESSEVVKVQQGTGDSASWEYYRCNMDNEWVQDVCPPGQQVNYDSTEEEVDCENIESVNIRATFFNVTNISFNSQSYTTGFKINRSELDKYQDVIGDPATVDAECWIGEDNQRPANSDGSVVFSAQDPGTGDLWMLEKLPARSNADNSTYSCLWGLRNTGGDSTMNIFDTSNNDPINSMDGGRIDFKFEDLQAKTTETSTSEIGRWVWDLYEKPEDGGYDSREIVNDQAHFMFDEEFPYCRGTSFWNNWDNTPFIRQGSAGTPQQLKNIVCSGGIGSDVDTYPDYANPPNADISGPTQVEAEETADYSGSGSSDSDGTVESYEWEVTDGGGSTVTSGTGQDFSFTPESAGTYTVELSVRDNIGALGTSTATISVEENVNTEDEFTIAYVPAYFEEDEMSEFSSLVDSSDQALKSNLKMDGSKLAKYEVDRNTCHITGCSINGNGDDNTFCSAKVESQCVGEDKPIDDSKFDKIHVICDNRNSYNGESSPCGCDNCGIGNNPGQAGASAYDGNNGRFQDTIVHEIGHNVGLEHIWNPEHMLDGDWSVGDTVNSGEDPVINQCISIPKQYRDPITGNTGYPFEIKDKHEDVRDGSESDGFENTGDNDETPASKTQNFMMSYCGPEEQFGPEGENLMKNGQLSGYQ